VRELVHAERSRSAAILIPQSVFFIVPSQVSLPRPPVRGDPVDYTCCESPDALRILLVAAQQGKSEKAASLALRRLRDEVEGEPQDIESLASEIIPIALDSPHPEHVIGTIVECLLMPDMPLMDRGTWNALASMTARECQANEPTAAIESEIRAQRRKALEMARGRRPPDGSGIPTEPSALMRC
jgi:hypothetical protein